MPTNPFYEIAAIFAIATALSIVGQKLRQPLIIMFLAAGILVGPAGLGLVAGHDKIALLADMGIALLLFIVGLKLDLHLIRTTGPVALATGLGQIVFTAALGFGIALLLGYSPLSSAYISVALTFSSTIIIIKLLSDKKEIDSLHGQIALGFLIVQDIAAILALVGLTALGAHASSQDSLLSTLFFFAVRIVGLLLAVGFCMHRIIPVLTRKLAYSQELLTLFAIAWAVSLAAASDFLGLHKEVGAFLAGVSLASTRYRDAIGARLIAIRDFLLLFFFIDLGARLDLSTVGAKLGDSLVFSIFVLIGNPLIVVMIMGYMGYRRRTSFLAGLAVAQISEFSLIVVALGRSLGHIDANTMGLVTLVGVGTIFASTYMILYSERLFELLSDPLRLFERRHPYRESTADSLTGALEEIDIILVGMGNYGSGIAESLLRRKKRVVGVDFDPMLLERWRDRGVPVLYGDMGDPDLFENLPIDKTHWVVNTVRNRTLNLSLLHTLQARGFRGRIALTAVNQYEADLYLKGGCHAVLRPFVDASEQAADALTDAMELLPGAPDFPVAFREVRLRADSFFAGATLRQIPLRTSTRVTILAVSRAGRVHYDPGPDFQLFPGDRLVIMGTVTDLEQAEGLLHQICDNEDVPAAQRFALGECMAGTEIDPDGKTLIEMRFRQSYRVTVIGIRRNGAISTLPGPDERVFPGDTLYFIGTGEAVEALHRKAEAGCALCTD